MGGEVERVNEAIQASHAAVATVRVIGRRRPCARMHPQSPWVPVESTSVFLNPSRLEWDVREVLEHRRP